MIPPPLNVWNESLPPFRIKSPNFTIIFFEGVPYWHSSHWSKKYPPLIKAVMREPFFLLLQLKLKCSPSAPLVQNNLCSLKRRSMVKNNFESQGGSKSFFEIWNQFTKFYDPRGLPIEKLDFCAKVGILVSYVLMYYYV